MGKGKSSWEKKDETRWEEDDTLRVRHGRMLCCFGTDTMRRGVQLMMRMNTIICCCAGTSQLARHDGEAVTVSKAERQRSSAYQPTGGEEESADKQSPITT